MFKSLLAATFAILFAGGSALAQNGGGYYGRSYGGYGRGYSGLPGNRDVGNGYYYPYYSGSSYYPYYGGYSYSPTYETTTYYPFSSGSAVVPYASVYPPAGSTNSDAQSPPIIVTGISPPASPPATTAGSTASIAVVVPQGGHVWFNGSMSPPRDNGSKWTFTTQKLEPGKTYVLDIKARFNNGAGDQSYNVPLRVQAGDNMTVLMNQMQ